MYVFFYELGLMLTITSKSENEMCSMNLKANVIVLVLLNLLVYGNWCCHERVNKSFIEGTVVKYDEARKILGS